MTRVTAEYTNDGKIAHLIVNWKGENIRIEPAASNGPTRELQRADEVVQALLTLERIKSA